MWKTILNSRKRRKMINEKPVLQSESELKWKNDKTDRDEKY